MEPDQVGPQEVRGAPDEAELAVIVRGACHEYRGWRRRSVPEPVLQGVDMTVRRGEVYALLGRSGCGKTTLLRALVGRHALDDGEVLVFGRAPGSARSGVPGHAVGYMPQGPAVHDGFTVGESLAFFGRLAGMPSTGVRSAADSLVAALRLPGPHQLVGALSGGEKRRVSLAIAMLHSPPLLVLDEPTVGLDPLLRHSTWELLMAAAARGTAVVISTHYTEEAVHADTVGLLRDGRMVLEDSPAAVLDRHGGHGADADGGAGLGEAVLCLCVSLSRGSGAPPAPRRQPRDPPVRPHGSRRPQVPATALVGHRLAALLWKDAVFLRRHWPDLAVQALFFVLITVLACAVLGHWPRGLRVDVVSEEADCAKASDPEPLSCVVLRALAPHGLSPVLQTDSAAAALAVRSGTSWAALRFGPNFTTAFVERVVHGGDDDDLLRASDIDVHLDTTDFVISNMIARRLVDVVSELVNRLNPSMSNFVKFEDPVFGSAEPVNTDTLMPGVLLGYMTTFAASLVMSTLLTEKEDRFMERTLAGGARVWELLVCWVAVLVPVMLAVNLASHLLVFGPMGVPCAGSTAQMYLLCSALCVMTMLAGLLFASLFDNYIVAILLCHQFAVSFLFLSGVLWPLQAMHWSLRSLALVMPWAHSMEAARAVLQRGWGLQHRQVWLGFGSCAVWAGLFLAGLVWVHRTKHRTRKRGRVR